VKARDDNIRARVHAVEEEEVVERLAELFEVETHPGGILDSAGSRDDGHLLASDETANRYDGLSSLAASKGSGAASGGMGAFDAASQSRSVGF